MMYNPPHPGEVLNELYIKPLGLSITKVAEALGVSRKTLSELVHGHIGISPEMAMRISLAFRTTPESWLDHQAQYELWKIKQSRKKFKTKQLVAA